MSWIWKGLAPICHDLLAVSNCVRSKRTRRCSVAAGTSLFAPLRYERGGRRLLSDCGTCVRIVRDVEHRTTNSSVCRIQKIKPIELHHENTLKRPRRLAADLLSEVFKILTTNRADKVMHLFAGWRFLVFITGSPLPKKSVNVGLWTHSREYLQIPI